MNSIEAQPKTKSANPREGQESALHVVHFYNVPQLLDQPAHRQIVLNVPEPDKPQSPGAEGVKNYRAWVKCSPRPEAWGIND
ncbi:MAG: hypothetical protein ACXW32_03925 [Limisphaerales bacterium]